MKIIDFPDFDPLQIGCNTFREGGTIKMEIPVIPAVEGYATKLSEEIFSKDAQLAVALPLDVAEACDYFLFLIKSRVQIVNGTCKCKNELKLLYVPNFIELLLSLIGVARDPDSNIVYEPQLHEEWDAWDKKNYGIDEAKAFSQKLALYHNCLPMSQHGVKFEPEGNLEFMSSCIMNRMGDTRVCFVQKPSHPSLQYLAAFVGLQCDEDDPYLFSQIGVVVRTAIEAIRMERRLL